ncbi:hypothetical protein DM2_2806 [Halorubrum sp. DM2]|nr:hypothetical protein DM2_2806 [Halorubrum sp. DM2]
MATLATARPYDDVLVYKQLIDTDTAEAPAGRRADARCAPRSFAPLTRCGAYVASARLPAAPSSPAPQQHLTPPQPRRRLPVVAADSLARRCSAARRPRRRAPPQTGL